MSSAHPSTRLCLSGNGSGMRRSSGARSLMRPPAAPDGSLDRFRVRIVRPAGEEVDEDESPARDQAPNRLPQALCLVGNVRDFVKGHATDDALELPDLGRQARRATPHELCASVETLGAEVGLAELLGVLPVWPPEVEADQGRRRMGARDPGEEVAAPATDVEHALACHAVDDHVVNPALVVAARRRKPPPAHPDDGDDVPEDRRRNQECQEEDVPEGEEAEGSRGCGQGAEDHDGPCPDPRLVPWFGSGGGRCCRIHPHRAGCARRWARISPATTSSFSWTSQ
jgi:hypothetical protein